MAAQHQAPVALPRVSIIFCTQCKWMLRAAYFGQELLSTFGTSIGEIALTPAAGGLFQVRVTRQDTTTGDVQEVLVWDRKTEGGFPETKILKQKIRDVIEPEKHLGHSDTPCSKGQAEADAAVDAAQTTTNPRAASDGLAVASGARACEDCR